MLTNYPRKRDGTQTKSMELKKTLCNNKIEFALITSLSQFFQLKEAFYIIFKFQRRSLARGAIEVFVK